MAQGMLYHGQEVTQMTEDIKEFHDRWLSRFETVDGPLPSDYAICLCVVTVIVALCLFLAV